MKVYLYLPPSRLDVLRHACLHLRPVVELGDPYLHNRRLIKPAQIHISDADFQQEIERQFAQLPASVQGLIDFATFQREARKRRSEIEARLRQQRQPQAIQLPALDSHASLACCSLYQRADNPLLWERHADQGRGLVLEFDAGLLAGKQQKQLLQPVIYGRSRPQANQPGHPFPALFHKAPEFAAEQEIRLVRPLSEASKCVPLKQGGQVCLYVFSPKALLSVTFGIHAADELREQVRRILNYDLKYKPGRLLREVWLDPQDFRLHLRGTL